MPLFWLAAPRDWQLVNEIVENFFGRVKISDSITKDECVATGACLALVKNYDPDEIIAYSLGQYVNGNEIQCVIPVNSKLPASRVRNHLHFV